ncbi:MAG TPA: YfdX family protein [Flavobacteriia bacterium]|nr:YfdX family protein [Flavobacteriia bacterium]
MKKIAIVGTLMMVMAITLTACAQNNTERAKNDGQATAVPQKEAVLEMNKDSLNAKILAEVEKEIVKRKVALTNEALTTISETQSLLHEIDKGDKNNAIKKGKQLIGNLEILLAKDPTLALIPVDVTSQREEFVADIKTVRETVKLAQKAMNKGHYRVASDLLKDLRSEMVINTFLIPTATYPDAIKAAVILLEEDDKEAAKSVLQEVLNTVVIERTILPIPILNAEQMIIEAATIDKKGHEDADKVLNLLKNADYQLQLAEEMGYGKKDKDFATLAKSIKTLKKSVTNKENSEQKFDSLKNDIRKFKERLFPKRKK